MFNNGQWGAEKKNQIDFYADRYRRHQPREPELRRDRAKRWAPRASRSTAPDQIGDALRQATASNRPTVLEIMATQELGDPFRRDALKKPKRLLEKYKAYTVA